MRSTESSILSAFFFINLFSASLPLFDQPVSTFTSGSTPASLVGGSTAGSAVEVGIGLKVVGSAIGSKLESCVEGSIVGSSVDASFSALSAISFARLAAFLSALICSFVFGSATATSTSLGVGLPGEGESPLI